MHRIEKSWRNKDGSGGEEVMRPAQLDAHPWASAIHAEGCEKVRVEYGDGAFEEYRHRRGNVRVRYAYKPVIYIVVSPEGVIEEVEFDAYDCLAWTDLPDANYNLIATDDEQGEPPHAVDEWWACHYDGLVERFANLSHDGSDAPFPGDRVQVVSADGDGYIHDHGMATVLRREGTPQPSWKDTRRVRFDKNGHIANAERSALRPVPKC